MEPVLFYTTHCPKCKVLEAKLKEKNIDYIENNNIPEMLARGIEEAPVLIVKDRMMPFAEAIHWVNGQEKR